FYCLCHPRDLHSFPTRRSSDLFRLSVEDRPGALAHVAEELADREISIARLLQHQNGDGAALHVVTHQARAGALEDALAALGELSDVHRRSNPLPVVSDRGVSELGWAWSRLRRGCHSARARRRSSPPAGSRSRSAASCT